MAFKKKPVKKEKKVEKKIESFENVKVKPEEVKELVEKLSGSAELAAKINSIIRGK